MVDIHDETPREAARDEADLARFGYKQELRRTLGVFSSFAVAFSYMAPSTGIFTLFALGLTTIGGVFIWSWPIVAIGQFIIALGWAELSSHYPVAGSVFQWTKYLSGKTYSWFAGWIYLFAGILTVTSVCVTLPLALIPAFKDMGWNLANNHSNQRIIAVITLALITTLNIFGVRLVALINNTGVLFEILGMVVFAFVLAIFHHHQSAGVIFHTGGTSLTTGTFLIAMFMSLYVIYGFDTASTLAEETKNPRTEAPKAVLASVIGAFVIGVLAFIPMIQFAGAGIVATAATGMIYLSYLIGNFALLRARLRGWPTKKAPFSLGRWGIPLSVLALAWGGGMLVNFAWPRAASNPTPNQTALALNFHWHWLNNRPVFWTVLVVVAAVGAVYFALVQRTKASHLEAPEGEVFATEGREPLVARTTP